MAPNNHILNSRTSIRSASNNSRSTRSRNSIFSISAGQKEVSSILDKTGQSKLLQYLKRMSIFILPMTTLVVMSALSLHQAATISASSKLAQKTLTRDLAVANLIHELQLERGFSTLRQVENSEEIQHLITKQITKVNDALKNIEHWVRIYIEDIPVNSKDDFMNLLNVKRQEFKMSSDQPSAVLHSYMRATDGLLRAVNSDFELKENGVIWRIMVAHLAIIQAMEYAALERSLGSIYLRTCQLSPDDQMLRIRTRAQSRVLLNVCKTYHEPSAILIDNLMPGKVRKSLDFWSKLTRSASFAKECQNLTAEEKKEQMWHWFDNMTVYISALGQTRRNLSAEIVRTIDKIVSDSRSEKIAYTLGSVFAISLGFLAGFWNAKGLARITETIGYHANKLHQNNARLNDERCRSETLLHSMLPTFVATKLKKGQHVLPRTYDSATVYFSDLLGFEQITTTLEPSFAVQLLNDIYTLFDGIIGKFDVYKVETVSDHYMVVSGLPEENGERHAVEIAKMALMLRREFSNTWRLEHCMGADLHLRAGFHSGPVVAGVVGKKLPRYCLFGDTVNTASRMQSRSIGGKIQVSQASTLILQKYDDVFILEERGLVEFKGKGRMQSYWLSSVEEETDTTGTIKRDCE